VGPTVRRLDDRLIDQIAAGEVIERPASLVKELLENAIDAGATAITVSVEDGGRGQVRVEDDGAGMSPEDAALSVERHATSKIASFDDLVRVATLGFRGEALASIGAVSKMTITTRPRQSLEGTRIVVEGGDVKPLEPAGCPPGTTVEVQDLFYNVPARKKFLRARQTETSRVFEVCQRLALSHPEVRLVVRSEGRVARRYGPATDLAERAYQVFGDVALQALHAEREGVALDAVFAPTELARAGARQLFLFVNDRPIVDRGLARAVAFAFGDRLAPGHYPRGVVALRLPPEDVDVNAHPQKTEVRFKRSAELLDRVTRMIAARLPSSTAGDEYWHGRLGADGPIGERASRAEVASRDVTGVAEPHANYGPAPTHGLWLVAQVRNRVLVCESSDRVFLLDREKADALGRFDALIDALERGAVERQTLLFPDRLELVPTESETLSRHDALLSSLGFDFSHLGERTYAVRSIPAVATGASPALLLRAALDALVRGKPDPRAVARAVAERSAVSNGEALDPGAAARIVACIEPDREEHRASVLASASMPLGQHNTDE
jgi:DNA mismatch repair protein MutL